MRRCSMMKMMIQMGTLTRNESVSGKRRAMVRWILALSAWSCGVINVARDRVPAAVVAFRIQQPAIYTPEI